MPHHLARSFLRRWVIVVAAFLWAAPERLPADTVRVPGGMPAIAQLIGPVREDPEEFIHSLNNALLMSINPRHAWKDLERRAVLHAFLEDVAELESRFPGAVTLGADLGSDADTLKSLATELGYKAKLKGGRLDLRPRDGDAATRRRQLAQALRWDLQSLERRPAGDSTVFELTADEVRRPVSAEEWASMLGGRSGTGEFLADLVRDQQLSLLLRARNRMTQESWATLGLAGQRQLALPMFRYAATLQVRDGLLWPPGGQEATAVWEEITDGRFAQPVDLARRLLDKRGARPAYLWHALSYTPPDVARFYLGVGGSGARFARGLYRRLDEIARADFSAARGGDLGFATFVRAMPIDTESGELLLPGGLGLWFTAVKAAEAPSELSVVRRIAAKGTALELDEGEFLRKALTEEADVGGVHRPVLPRLTRTANLFPGRPELLTPELVVLAARASDTMPLTLAVLHDLEPSGANGPRDYLLAAAHLDHLPNNPERELLILNFQGGAEWLRVMARAGKVDSQTLTELLGEWGRIHQRVTSAAEAAAPQLAWIAGLLEELPSPLMDSAGRGPREQALIHAIVEPGEHQEFSWQGLDYRGERGADHARAMAERLVNQGVPTADLLYDFHRHFEGLAAACESESIEEAMVEAGALRDLVGQLPPIPADFARGLKNLTKRVFPHDRERLQRLVQEVLSVKKAKRLSGKLDEISRARETLAGDLKSFLLAPGYLAAMRDEDNILYEDPYLIRKHLAQKELGPDLITDNPWGRPEVVVESEQLGAHIRGHAGGVAAAMAQFSRLSGGTTFLERDEMWLEDSLRTRWHELRPEVSALAHHLVAAGRAIVEMSLAELSSGSGGPATDFVAARIPLYRLEKEVERKSTVSRVSPSERFLLGLALISKDGFLELERPLPEAMSEALRAAQLELGDGWRRELDRIAVASPELNGNVRQRMQYVPPYEMVENETLPRALWQREMLDLKVSVADYLGRHRLPGEVGFDLMSMVLRDASSSMPQTGPRDWEDHLHWVNQLDEDYFSKRMRECLASGLYKAQGL